ncbi:sulfurtransferase [Cryobacterium sp. TMT2-15-1]|uniref:sulfurtransferase n=1 Tax=Cryobacterium sp. TMT2-15-1 TaxID=1259246 RepID=UPI00106CC536|nr:sulfurtransferase [Cryobacterium sp. TMT2-15-1]TFC60585.1 sulfurtransferase [Cryobacterium sp. TMT2-15-1]
MRILITADELAAMLECRSDVRVLDVRWKLGGPPGPDEYRAGHIPGAVYVDLETELARPGEPADGRHPLPTRATLQAAARRWGLRDGDTVVVYDDLGGMTAARAWWLLRHAGVRDVLLLDGSLAAWRTAGLPLAAGGLAATELSAETVRPGTITLSDGVLPVLDTDAAAALAQTGALLDARAAERYCGDTEPVDPRAGHIPGAISAPTADNLTLDGRFLPAAELRARFEALGVTAGGTVGVYCGSGVTAAHEAAALAIAGFSPALYPGSWSQWSNLPGRPVATGDPRARNPRETRFRSY